MWQQFSGNGIFAFSDPAGAKACLALNEILNAEKVPGKRVLFSNKAYTFYKQFESNVNIINIKDAKGIKTEFDWIFLGTSHPDSSKGFELYMLKSIIAKKSYSFIDHWTNFKIRFTLNNNLIFPSIIFVVDEKAKQLAISDGLPENDIIIFDNPYLTYLKLYNKSIVSKNTFCKVLGISNTKKIVLFAPDPISLRSNNSQNEIEILKELISICGNDFTLLLKLHPLQPLEAICKIIEVNPSLKLIDDNLFLPQDVFRNVDFIIGFYSNYLLEASVLNKNIIRYILNNDQIDYLSHCLPENSIVVNSEKSLNFAIKSKRE